MIADRVLITGCGGMLGNAVYPYFTSKYENVLASDKKPNGEWLMRLDVRDEVHLGNVFRDFKPEIVVHLAAETDLEYCEVNSEIAKDTNSLATKSIAKLSEEYGSTLIYISTAGVFDGLKDGFYTEQDQPNPIMVYGQTKYEGELHALKHCSKSFVVRAGWMMGGGRKNEKKFIYKILQQIEEGKKEIFAVIDRWGTPTYTYDFAMNLSVLLKTRQYGTYHMACEGKGTRYDVAKEILRICKRPDIKLTAVDSEFFKEEYFAPRPPSEMMLNDRLRKIGINYMRPWEISLQDYIENHFPDFIAKPEMKYTRVKRPAATRIQALKSLTKDGEMGRLKKKQA
jgi:dTDP-4-dehydrorhamnose reductase